MVTPLEVQYRNRNSAPNSSWVFHKSCVLLGSCLAAFSKKSYLCVCSKFSEIPAPNDCKKCTGSLQPSSRLSCLPLKQDHLTTQSLFQQAHSLTIGQCLSSRNVKGCAYSLDVLEKSYIISCHLLVLCISKFSMWITQLSSISSEYIQISVYAKQQLTPIVASGWLHNLQNIPMQEKMQTEDNIVKTDFRLCIPQTCISKETMDCHC